MAQKKARREGGVRARVGERSGFVDEGAQHLDFILGASAFPQRR